MCYLPDSANIILWLQVHSFVGAPVRKHLPAGLNPKILEQLEAEFAAQPGSPATAGGTGRAAAAGTPLGGGGRNAPAPRPASPPVPAVARRLSEVCSNSSSPFFFPSQLPFGNQKVRSHAGISQMYR